MGKAQNTHARVSLSLGPSNTVRPSMGPIHIYSGKAASLVHLIVKCSLAVWGIRMHC